MPKQVKDEKDRKRTYGVSLSEWTVAQLTEATGQKNLHRAIEVASDRLYAAATSVVRWVYTEADGLRIDPVMHGAVLVAEWSDESRGVSDPAPLAGTDRSKMKEYLRSPESFEAHAVPYMRSRGWVVQTITTPTGRYFYAAPAVNVVNHAEETLRRVRELVNA